VYGTSDTCMRRGAGTYKASVVAPHVCRLTLLPIQAELVDDHDRDGDAVVGRIVEVNEQADVVVLVSIPSVRRINGHGVARRLQRHATTVNHWQYLEVEALYF